MQQEDREEMYFVWRVNWFKPLTTQWKVMQQPGREEVYFVWRVNWFKPLTTQWKIIQQQGRGIMSSVWGMIHQWASTIKVSIELPVAIKHRRDTTQ